jgi:hypothetical protein
MAPQAGSPLINAGSNALVPTGLDTDQRGVNFRRINGGTVDIGSVETQVLGVPDALSSPVPLTVAGGTTYTFQVTYEDPTGTNKGIQVATVDGNSSAVIVKDPSGNVLPVTFVSVTPTTDGTPLIATYSIVAPGGTWDGGDDGVYTLQVAPNQVQDLDGNSVPADVLGPIDIFIPRTLVVTNDNDSGPGSLRDAFDQATLGSDDTITFDPTFFNVPRTISLQTPLPFEGADSGALTIQGPGADLLTVQRDPSAATDFRVIYSAAPNLVLSNFTITGGTGVAAGAATFGTTTLDHMVLTGNMSSAFAGGLYIGNNKDVTVVDSLISGNTAATDVGGILVSPGAHLVLDHSTVSGNTAAAGVAGGVLVDANATLDVIDSTISGNTAGTVGGGVFLYTGATLNLINSTLSGNTAASGPGGGVFGYVYASVNVVNSTISGNSATTNGGGIYFFDTGSLTVESSTISGNQTTASADNQGGGGIYFFGASIGDIVIENSTIANNTSAGSGGGILLANFNGLLELFNSTVSGNTALSTTSGYGGGGVVDRDGYGTIGLLNSVVSGNTNVNAPDILSPYPGQVLAFSSLIFSPNGFNLATGSSGNLPFFTDPMLGPLQDNGGPTETMAPLAGSPLLNAGDITLIQPGITTDQRGLDRVDSETGLVDIGAVEAQAATVTIAPAVGQANPTNDNTAVNFTVVFDQPVTGFDASGIDLTGSTATGNLVVNVTPVSSTVYTVTITGITGDGDVVASVLAGTATVGVNASGQGNLPSPAAASVTVDTTPPTVTVNQDPAQLDPTNASPITFDIQFDEPVTGFDQTMLTLGGTLAADASIVNFFPGAAPNSWVVVVGVTGTNLTGTVTVSVPAGETTDPAGNQNTASGGDNSVTFDNAPPTVTINQASTQGDPGGGLSVSFDVVFSEPVVGFNGSKVDLSASTAPGTLVATVTGAGPVYTVTVTGMTGGGTVVASIDAGVVTDLAENLNLGSTFTDNSVTYVHSGVIHLSAASYSISEVGAPQLTITVQRTDGSDGALDIHYSTADGTAVAGTDYTAVSGNLHWDAGNTADKTFTVQILDDGGFEADSAFTVNLSNIPNITLPGALGTPATATVNINEEAALGFTSSTYNTAESGTGTDMVKQITVSRQFGSHGAVSVDYTVTGVTATAGADYSALASGTLTWADGDTADKTINVTIHDDTFSEGKETINLALSNPTGGAVLGTSAATLIIAPSDGVTIQATAKSPQVTLPADADGNIVTIRLGGKVGSFTYYLTNDAVPVSEIDLNGTVSTKSTLSITVKKARGFSGTPTATIGAIDGTGIDGTGTAGLKTLSLGKVNLVGDGIAGDGITFNGYVGSVVVGDVLNGADILLNGTATTPRGVPLPARITAGQIEGSTATGLTDITVAAPLASLRAIRIGQGTITAPSVGAIAVTGKAKTRTAAAIPGDLQSDITVAGTGLASTKVPALRSLRVAGAVQGSTITVGGGAGTDGNVGTVSVGAFVASVLFAGYAGPADGSGTFNLPATVGTFVVRPPTKAAPNNEFAGSHVIAANFNTVSVGAVDPDDGGTKFGFTYHTALRALTVKEPAFRFDPAGPAVQDLIPGDFEVKKV